MSRSIWYWYLVHVHVNRALCSKLQSKLNRWNKQLRSLDYFGMAFDENITSACNTKRACDTKKGNVSNVAKINNIGTVA